ncbi:hypothetical protein JTE90_011441 [Oedothorax gibbosus]|uniref:C2H2-type domain-containing protein n=1 Tax=Oedothorax gibbosus TaxID=931172 RepID=A0AAV6VBY9_9ARAC|nr:hypothetical protein JTE90_011441 [Oedothorax gibbosus]
MENLDMRVESHGIIYSEGIVETLNTKQTDEQFIAKKNNTSEGQVDKKPPVCPLCNHQFTFNYILQQHLSKKQQVCDVCGKQFCTEQELKLHHLSHSNKTPYTCEVCNKHFLHRTSVTKHMRIHNRQEYACKQCDRSFRQEGLLQDHIQKKHNKNYTCEVCHKQFVRHFQLKCHMTTHTDAKTYVYSLRLHVATHAIVKKFICDICQKGFALQSFLSKHVRQTHLAKYKKDLTVAPINK